MADRLLNVGILGCGQSPQILHIPTLENLCEKFKITYLCSASNQALESCARKISNKYLKTTSEPAVLCSAPSVDVVFVVNASELHAEHTILALQHDKHVFVEKPLAMTEKDVHKILEVEQKSKGNVFVGYMRRYAPAFIDAVEMIGGIEKILYARVRDIIGPNSVFVDQAGMHYKPSEDFDRAISAKRAEFKDRILTEALVTDCQVEPTDEQKSQYEVLCGLGAHDISAMREALGMPDNIRAASFDLPFWNVLIRYPKFTVSYESGFYDVPVFDAHLEVYSAKKSVRIQWDSPYIKGLPVTLLIREEENGGLKETRIRRTYEDNFISELNELYEVVTSGKPIKTSAADALQDLRLFQQMLRVSAGAK